jgi:hypothetical protein
MKCRDAGNERLMLTLFEVPCHMQVYQTLTCQAFITIKYNRKYNKMNIGAKDKLAGPPGENGGG